MTDPAEQPDVSHDIAAMVDSLNAHYPMTSGVISTVVRSGLAPDQHAVVWAAPGTSLYDLMVARFDLDASDDGTPVVMLMPSEVALATARPVFDYAPLLQPRGPAGPNLCWLMALPGVHGCVVLPMAQPRREPVPSVNAPGGAA